MRVYMQTPPQGDRAPRFCHLIIQRDLLSGWTLLRETGTQGSRGRIRRHHFDGLEQATNALMAERERQLRRGFQVVFTAAGDTNGPL